MTRPSIVPVELVRSVFTELVTRVSGASVTWDEAALDEDVMT